MKQRSVGCICVVALLVAFTITRAGAEESSSGISVVGVGTVKGKPDTIEVTAAVTGEGELANDASVKYRDARKKAVEALEALKYEGLSIESKGLAVNQAVDANAQMRMMQGMGTESGKQKVAVSETLTILLKDADKLELDKMMEMVLKLIDVGRDNGLVIGPGNMNYYQMQIAMQSGQGMSMIAFKIPDATALRDQAYKLAIQDARKKAERVADLAGVKLGRILSVVDQDAPPKGNEMMNYYYMMYAMSQQNKEQETGLSSNVFGQIPLSVRLNVQFEIAK